MTPPAEAPAAPPPIEVARVPVTFDGHHLGDLHVSPGTSPALVSRALGQLAVPAEWSQLGADLAALGPHRLAIAARAATAAAGGGRGANAEEADHIAQWFCGLVDEAIHRGGLPAAVAIWVVLAGDSQADPVSGRSARCPSVAEVPLPPTGFSFEPGEPSSPGESAQPGQPTPDPDEVAAFLAGLRAAAPGYVHTAIACASDSDLRELREIVLADDHALEELRPWGIDLAADVPASASLEDARSMLTYRRLSSIEACSGFADWAHGFAGMVAEHALPPALRIGAVAWLARVALGPADAAACACPAREAEAASAALPPAADAAPDNDHAAPARPLVRHCLALEAAGWHVTELRPHGITEPLLWRVTIERYDENLTMTIPEAADPEAALADLLRYVQADAS
jgi:hypothetical protein